MIDLFDNTLYQLSTCRTKTWMEVKDEARGRYSTDNQIKFKVITLKASLCDYL